MCDMSVIIKNRSVEKLTCANNDQFLHLTGHEWVSEVCVLRGGRGRANQEQLMSVIYCNCVQQFYIPSIKDTM